MRHWIPVTTLFILTLALGAAARLYAPSHTNAAGGLTTASHFALAAHATLDRNSVLRGGDGLVRAELVLRGRDGDALAPARLATDLVVVLDRSGSMQGQPLQTALGATRELISGLADGDRFALVSYASGARLDLPFEAATAQSRARWLARIGAIRANGGTDLSSGLDQAHALLSHAQRAGRAVRVIVLSDGLANQGDHSLDGLRRRAGRAVGSEYVLSSVGIGDGFDENVMGALADAGAGNFYYLPDLSRLAGVFAQEFAAARETVARGLSVSITPAPGVRLASAGGYPLDRDGAGLRFHPGDLFAGQERRIWLSFHAPTGELGEVSLGEVRLDFRTPSGEAGEIALGALPALACVAGEDDYYASFDSDTYRRGNLSDAVGALKQSVSKLVKEGRQAEAVAEVDAYVEKSRNESLNALGYVVAEEKAELETLRDTIAAPSAAEPMMRNRLGKSLLESGRDAQRAGAKK